MIAHLWQSTLFAGTAGLLTLLLRKNRARTRYWVWLAGLVKFLAPFAVLVSLGGHINLPRWTPKAPAIVEPAISFVMVGDIGDPGLTTVQAAPQTKSNSLLAILFSVWACGFVGITFFWIRRWIRVRADVRAASPLPIEVGIPVVSSPVLHEPGVFGIFRPVLLLPKGMEQHLSTPEWKCILAHELCHVRYYDNLTASIYMLVQAIFWFHPLVWWLGDKLVTERELACDEEVLRLGSEPKAYAEGILKVCELYLESPLECVAGVTGSNLRRRIRAIMTHRGTERLKMGKRLLLTAAGVTALLVPIVVGVLHAQPVPIPKFEVASIRPCEPAPDAAGRRGGSAGVTPGRLSVNCMPVMSLIQSAYVSRANAILKPFDSVPISGGPAWLKSDRYNIEAKAEGNPSLQLMEGPMLQALLEDRFKLKIHQETREIPVYDLTIAKSGFKLQPMKDGDCTPFDPFKPLDLSKTPAELLAGCGGVRYGTPRGEKPAFVEYHGMTLDEIAGYLVSVLDRPVINKTGIAGTFHFHVEFAPDGTIPKFAPTVQDDAPGGPSIFTAFQGQLGLKLEPAKGPGEMLVIDHVERPSEN